MDEHSGNKLVGVEGEVKWFDPKKGYGFIVGPEGQDIFIHFSQIEGEGFRSFTDGQRVEYDAEKDDRGWNASRAKVVPGDVVVRSQNAAARSPRR